MSVVAGGAAAGAIVAAATWSVSKRWVRPRRSPQTRVASYVERARAQLGGPATTAVAPLGGNQVLARVLGPLAGGVVRALGRLTLLAPADKLELSLRQAGLGPDIDGYRKSCLCWALGTPLALGLAALATGRSAYVVAGFIAGLFAGARRGPERLAAGTRRRNDRLRNDLPAVAAALALRIDNNKSLVVALADLLPRGDGPVVEDLARALHLVRAGYGEASAFELVAQESAEPAAARFYRFLSMAVGGGIDLSRALLDQANELRRQRREEVERSAARRQMALVLPNMVFMAPVLFAFILAPLPRLLFAK